MKIAVLPLALLLATAAAAQGRADLPSGSPLGAVPLQVAPDAALIEAQRARQARSLALARARAQQQQRAMAEAFAPRPATIENEAPARTAASLAGSVERITKLAPTPSGPKKG